MDSNCIRPGFLATKSRFGGWKVLVVIPGLNFMAREIPPEPHFDFHSESQETAFKNCPKGKKIRADRLSLYLCLLESAEMNTPRPIASHMAKLVGPRFTGTIAVEYMASRLKSPSLNTTTK